MDALEATCIPEYLQPDELGQLATCGKELDDFFSPFLQTLASKGLISGSVLSQLSSFSSTFEHKYVQKRRCSILYKARSLLLNNDYHNTVEVGMDVLPNKDDDRLGLSGGMAVFRLQKSSISDTASRVMELCRKTMEEAVEQRVVSGESPLALLPPTLYRTAREVLDQFRAIIPVTHGHEIANVPRTAAVHHNDCVFIAYHCLSLGLEFREKFSFVDDGDSRANLLRQTCIFVDMVPLFRDLAERSMGDMLDRQARQVSELVGERIVLLGESLRSDEIVSEWSDAENAIAAGLYHLNHLSKAWKPILSRDVLNRSVGYLADILFSLLLDQITKATDISTNACQFVGTQFEKVNNEIGALMEDGHVGSQLWDRFLAVGRFMFMSLADVQAGLSEGRSISGPELSKLVLSCFNESPKRQTLLKLLSANK